jgi:hypothetical protein
LKSLPFVVTFSERQSGHLLDVSYSLFSSTSIPSNNVVEAPEAVYHAIYFIVMCFGSLPSSSSLFSSRKII